MAKRKTRKITKTVAELLDQDFADLGRLAREIDRLRLTVGNFPDNVAYTNDNLDTLETVRSEALRLALECELVIGDAEGKQPPTQES